MRFQRQEHLKIWTKRSDDSNSIQDRIITYRRNHIYLKVDYFLN